MQLFVDYGSRFWYKYSCVQKRAQMNIKFLTNLVNFLLTIVNKFDILSIACGKEELVKKVFKKIKKNI